MNASADGKQLLVDIDDESFRLDELGSGIAHFVITLASVAIRPPLYLFIDEPELGLHPSLQLEFLSTLASFVGRSTVVATHSIGLAKSLGGPVFSTRKSDRGTTTLQPIEATTNLAEFLGEINFSSYRELGFEKLLLVEGSTDILVVLHFLRELGRDQQVVVTSLGGADMIKKDAAGPLNELLRITTDVAVLIDSERESAKAGVPPERKEFQATCKKLGIDIKVLQRRATENYLSETAIRAELGPKYRALGPFEKLAEVPLGWAKQNNWKIAKHMRFVEIEGTDLGRWLAKV